MKHNKLHMMLLSSALALIASPAWAGFDELNMTRGVTPISERVYDLHMIILAVCIVIGLIVFGAMAWSIFHHRKSRGAVAATFHESTKMEILWTAIPFLVLIFIAVPATSTLLYMSDTQDSDISIKVTGHQWKWQYEYMGEGVNFISNLHPDHNDARQKDSGVDLTKFGDTYLLDVDNPLVLPVNKKVRFLLTASDVIHAFWVPELGQKMDAIPGYINEMWTQIQEPGVYRGQCAELCGKDHGFMPIVIKAVSEDEYTAWLGDQKKVAEAAALASGKDWSKEDLMAKGENVYKTNCMACHGLNGEGGVGKAIAGSPIAIGPAEQHTDMILKGVAGTAMAGYAAILNDLDLAAVITYQRNAFGNSGSLVQPSEVKAAR